MKLPTYLIQYFITASFILTSLPKTNAQIEFERYKAESIYLKNSKYVKNDIEYPIGFWGQHLKKEMEVSQEAMMEYRNFEQNRKTAFILSTIGLASVFSAFIVDNRNLQAGLILGGVGISIVSQPIHRKAGNSFQKAIWIRNRDILLDKE